MSWRFGKVLPFLVAVEPSLQEERGGDHIDLAPHLLLIMALFAKDPLRLA